MACVLLLTCSGRPVSAQVSPDKLKAVYLYNFGNYIEWPAVSTPASSSKAPFVIGIVGETHPVHSVLSAIAAKKKLNGRTIQPQFIDGDEEELNCDIIYFPVETPKAIVEALRTRLNKKPVLLVGETLDFAKPDSGGMINFFTSGTAIRFEINPDTIKNVGLKASSKLIQLGTVIRG